MYKFRPSVVAVVRKSMFPQPVSFRRIRVASFSTSSSNDIRNDKNISPPLPSSNRTSSSQSTRRRNDVSAGYMSLWGNNSSPLQSVTPTAFLQPRERRSRANRTGGGRSNRNHILVAKPPLSLGLLHDNYNSSSMSSRITVNPALSTAAESSLFSTNEGDLMSDVPSYFDPLQMEQSRFRKQPSQTNASQQEQSQQPNVAESYYYHHHPTGSQSYLQYQQQQLHHQPQIIGTFPVAAMHMAKSIELDQLNQALTRRESVSPSSVAKNIPNLGRIAELKFFGKNSIVVRVNSRHQQEQQPHEQQPHEQDSYVAIFRFGSVVFFNLSPVDVERWMVLIRQHANDLIPTGTERKENYGVLVRSPPPPISQHPTTPPSLSPESSQALRDSSLDSIVYEYDDVVTGDYCMVQELDMNGVAVIAYIMGQSVALDTYNDNVDVLLTEFARINAQVSKTANLSSREKNFLFKSVSRNNSIVIDMISKIRIKDRSDTAWNLTKYEKIHYGMRDEFEIDDRFDHIEFKLNLIQQNAKFFLEVMHHQKANSLEWIIVVLIGVECVIMCVDMTGTGKPIFDAICTSLGFA